MKPRIYVLFIFFIFLVSCEKSTPATEASISGTWKCQKLPIGLYKELNINESSYQCEIVINKNGTFKVKKFPVRDPYELIDFEGSWSLISGDSTPSGKDSVVLENYHLSIVDSFGVRSLNYLISGKDEYSISFYKD